MIYLSTLIGVVISAYGDERLTASETEMRCGQTHVSPTELPLLLTCYVLGLPPEMYAIWEAYPWRFGEPYCLFKTFLTEITTTASVLTISAFTVERYLAICHPLRAQTTYNLERASRVIVVIWLVACAASIPFPLNTRTFYYVADPRDGSPLADSFVCNIPTDRMSTMNVVFLVYTFVLFVVPMLTIVGLYAAIGLTLRRRARVELAVSTMTRGGRDSLDRDTGGMEMTPINSRYRQSTTNRLNCSGRLRASASVYISGRQAVLKVLCEFLSMVKSSQVAFNKNE